MSQLQKGFVIEPHFSVGDVLSRTIFTLLDKPLFFFGLSALATLPSAVINSITFASGLTAFISFFINLLFGLMIQGAIAYGVFISLAGDDPTWNEALARGFRRVFQLFLIALIFWILCIFFVAVSTMLAMFFRSAIAAIIIILLMIVAGTALICSWPVTIQACVVEELGPINSINRSAELTKGYRWHLFGLLTLITVGCVILIVILSVIISSILPAHMLVRPQIQAAVFFVVGLFSTAFIGVMCSVIYYDLRALKEGLTIDSLANIFD